MQKCEYYKQKDAISDINSYNVQHLRRLNTRLTPLHNLHVVQRYAPHAHRSHPLPTQRHLIIVLHDSGDETILRFPYPLDHSDTVGLEPSQSPRNSFLVVGRAAEALVVVGWYSTGNILEDGVGTGPYGLGLFVEIDGEKGDVVYVEVEADVTEKGFMWLEKGRKERG